VEALPDDDPQLVRLEDAGCFVGGEFIGGEQVGHVVRLHCFHGPTGSPTAFLDDLANAAARDAADA
jgi:hypothetical protein